MKKQREVQVLKWVKNEAGYSAKVFDCNGILIAWGVDYEELSMGVGMYTVAIVELPDGSIKTPPAEMVVFKHPISKE